MEPNSWNNSLGSVLRALKTQLKRLARNYPRLLDVAARITVVLVMWGLLAFAMALLVTALVGCEPMQDDTPTCTPTDTLCIKTLPCRSCTDNCGNPVPVDSVVGCSVP